MAAKLDKIKQHVQLFVIDNINHVTSIKNIIGNHISFNILAFLNSQQMLLIHSCSSHYLSEKSWLLNNYVFVYYIYYYVKLSN